MRALTGLVVDRFTLRAMLERSSQDASFLGSYLHYVGMLTLRKERTETQTLEPAVANQVVRGFFERLVVRPLSPQA